MSPLLLMLMLSLIRRLRRGGQGNAVQHTGVGEGGQLVLGLLALALLEVLRLWLLLLLLCLQVVLLCCLRVPLELLLSMLKPSLFSLGLGRGHGGQGWRIGGAGQRDAVLQRGGGAHAFKQGGADGLTILLLLRQLLLGGRGAVRMSEQVTQVGRGGVAADGATAAAAAQRTHCIFHRARGGAGIYGRGCCSSACTVCLSRGIAMPLGRQLLMSLREGGWSEAGPII